MIPGWSVGWRQRATMLSPVTSVDGGRAPWSDWALRWASRALVLVVWVSAGLFGLYILAYYLGTLWRGEQERWNEVLPDLYDPQQLLATAGIGLHFLAGGVILVLGPIQLSEAIRRRAPGFHRWCGRLYALSALVAGVGGLLFIALQGTIGGWPMDVGFALYGALMILAAVETARHAIARRFEAHRRWGLRLFSLAIGSWLYRMEYGLWFTLFGRLGHTSSFDGWFDVVMAFAFYLPNLALVELLLRVRSTEASPAARWLLVGLVASAGVFVTVATVTMTRLFWGPAILELFGA